ncbi:MAG: prephenate dehydrogenase/arogenate dehydrogenase family protein [Candidatus Binataceae bacterium]|nr:prephenate dehydrogenase/arogenate dehydrogenase family protein [Candidatus Binataceae bacterium]
MSALFKQITICGVGLIGGSLALAARQHHLAEKIVGLGRSEANLKIARDRGMLDLATRDPIAAAHGAELVMLATPIRLMPVTLRAMREALPHNAIVTDAGSVKQWVIDHLEPELGAGMALVGAHPIAGKETTGAAAADPALFVDQRVIITPSARSTPAAIEKIEMLWRRVGARVSRMAPDLHDLILSRASHLPQIVASTLAAALNNAQIGSEPAAAYGAGGLRDTTRLAASSADMWLDILVTNREAILGAAAEFRAVLDEFGSAIDNRDEVRMRAILEQGRAMRAKLP